MKKKNRLRRKFIDLIRFEELFQEFLSKPTWTKQKHDARDVFYEYLESMLVTSIRVKPHSKYNYCNYTHSFTILRVPLSVKGKLYPLRGEVVLIRCSSFAGAWTQYSNDIYLLEQEPSDTDHKRLKQLYGDYYVSNPTADRT